MRRIAAIAIVLATVLVPQLASAHQPWFNTGTPDLAEPFDLPVPITTSQVLFSGFTDADQIDFYRFRAPREHQLEIRLVVADDPACAEFQPAFAIVGPGITPDPTTADLVGVPELPEEFADARIVSGSEWGTFFEPFSRTTFVTGPELGTSLDGGVYLIAVFDPNGGAGTYGVSINGAETRGGEPEYDRLFPAWKACAPVRTEGETNYFDPSGL